MTPRPEISRRGLLSLSLGSLFCCLPGMARPAQLQTSARVIALDWGMAQALLSIGVVPVGVADIPGYSDFVVEPVMPAGVVDVGRGIEPNLELLARLKPDLFVMTQQFFAIRPILERIAPTLSFSINSSERKPFARARAATLELAMRLGATAVGEAYLQMVDTELSALDISVGQTPPIYVAQIEDERHVTLHGRGGIFQDVLDRLGITNAWQGGTNDWGFTTVGIEELAQDEDAAFVSVGRNDPVTLAALSDNPIWNAMPFVKLGRCAFLAPTLFYGTLPSATRFARLLANTLSAEGRG